MKRIPLTQGKLHHMLSYNKHTGVFIWKRVSKYHSRLNGQEAGTIRISRRKQYRWIKIEGKAYAAHRLAWFFVYGKWPHITDHKNGHSLDNKIANLNDVDVFMNTQNHKVKIRPDGLPTGVRKAPSGRFIARIKAKKRPIHLGTFDTIEEADGVYKAARDKLHYCPRVTV